jgi:hypothetical protein
MGFIVVIPRFGRKDDVDYIGSRAGWSWDSEAGKFYRDGTSVTRSSPGVTRDRDKAIVFKTHRAAARQASKFHDAEVKEI